MSDQRNGFDLNPCRGQWPFEIENRSSRHTAWNPSQDTFASRNHEQFCIVHKLLPFFLSLFHDQFSNNFGRGLLSGSAET